MHNKNHLSDLVELDKKARNFGFEWPNYQSILNQIISECEEIKEAIESQQGEHHIKEEVSDAFHAVISLCVFLNLDINDIIVCAENKFSSRMKALVKIAEKEYQLQNIRNQPIELKMKLWKKAKISTD